MNNVRGINAKDRELLLDLSMSASTGWEILVASGNTALSDKVKDIFADDDRVSVLSAPGEGHALLQSARISPDLLIIDDVSNDFPPEKVIHLLKSDTSLADMFILCGITSPLVDEVPDWGADDYFSLKNLDSVYLMRKITSLIFLSEGDDSSTVVQPHERISPRTKLNLSATIEMISLGDAGKTEMGKAFVEDISENGALLSDIKLPDSGIPLEPYHIRLKINEPPLNNWTADSVVVRMKDYGSAGVKFLDISKQDQKQIDDLLHR